MRKAFTRLLLLGGIAIAVTVTVVLFNQLVQLARFGFGVADWLGWTLVILLVAVYVVAIGYPAWSFLRLPNRMKPPETDDGPEFDAYLERLSRRLKRNRYVQDAGIDPSTTEGRTAALQVLDDEATKQITEMAQAVFISTAISQNGRLDGLLVLIGLSRMVWRVAHIYQERPNGREILSLYNNVAVTALLAMQVEDLNIDHQIEPVVRSALGSGIAGMVPGALPITTVLLASILEGTANAFLTLRVGLVAKEYCASTVRRPKRELSRSALVQSTKLLGGIVFNGARTVSGAVSGALRNAGTGAFQSLTQSVTDVFTGKFWSEPPRDPPPSRP